MKSRLTTYMLLAAAIAVWGAIAWKLLSPDEDIPPAAPHARADDTECEPVADTLIADYPDPFLKTATPQTVTPPKPMRALPERRHAAHSANRENIACEHLGTIRAESRTIYIIEIDGEQYEAKRGDSVAGFVLSDTDRDSLYLMRSGVKYGVKLCE